MEANRAIFRAAVELSRLNETIDPVTIRSKAGAAASQEYMLDLMQTTQTAANAGVYAQEARKDSMRRSIRLLADSMETKAAGLDEPRSIRINGENGVYGTTRTQFAGQRMEVAFAQEVTTGSAEIWSTVSGETPRPYQVRIERISDADPKRNMVLRVTDPALLAQTGGIVQGMSGSPIVQNGRLVGAVTHVLVNDPTRGYGIFAQTMLEQAEIAAQRAQDTESSK